MLALRYVYLLALAIWLGGMVVLGGVVAPLTFGVLQASDPDTGRALAGALFGAVLARFHLVASGAGITLLVTLAGMALLGPRPRRFAVRVSIAAAMLAVTLYAGTVVLANVEAIQQEIGGLPSALAADDPRRLEFDRLHQLSTRLMMLTLLGGLALLYFEAHEPER